MRHPAQYRLINIDVAVPDFYIEAAFGISTDPDFVVYWCTLTSEIGQGHQVASITFLALGKNKVLHRATSHLGITRSVYIKSKLLAT